MYDLQLRPVKERVLRPLCAIIPSFVTPTHLTVLAFGSGLLSCFLSAFNSESKSTYHDNSAALLMWILNRLLDSLDGSLARHRGTASEIGAFLDLLYDFIVYSLIPISVTYGNSVNSRHQQAVVVSDWMVVALLEATIHINNFVLFYVAAVKVKKMRSDDGDDDELTSLSMQPALVEGFESGVFFTLMIAFPQYTRILSLAMAAAVALGTWQRVVYVLQYLGEIDAKQTKN